MNIFRAFIPAQLFKDLEPYRITEAEIPWAYSVKNPDQRQLHGDWFAAKKTPRIDGARKTAAYMRCVKGSFEKRWVLTDPNYCGGFAPGVQFATMPVWDGEKDQDLPHAFVDCAVEGEGWSEWEVYLPHLKIWKPCVKFYRGPLIFGKRLKIYYGYKFDLTVAFDENHKIKSDMMGWIEPPTMSWT